MWKERDQENYQMNDYLRRKIFVTAGCLQLLEGKNKKNRKSPDKYIKNSSCLQRSVCACVCVSMCVLI